MPPLCRHCGRDNVNRPRGLCWTCFYTPGLRDRYPSVGKYARRGVGNIGGGHALPEPTAALPGSPEKLAVLAARAAAGQSLFGPADAVGPARHSGHASRQGPRRVALAVPTGDSFLDLFDYAFFTDPDPEDQPW